ncbi:DUF6913 domain-containing protein [Capnocytophaga canimorsus]|uniref:DUF6913 domain-containing protein n=1 Tax=Capnocytophaga canimorsus TaxID=28188 RepID=UPI001BB44D6C|nr:hypothetical protein [Capnocytophaga canimorsus]
MIKDYYIKKIIQKNLQTLKKSSANQMFDKISKVGCIIDMDTIKDVQPLLQLVNSFNLRPENYIFLGYQKKSEETHIGGIPFLTDREINWQGKIRNYHADRLAEQEYDILINYFDQPKLPLLLLSSTIQAKLRIGVQGIAPDFNDIIVQCPLKKEALFAQEVKKILKTLNKTNL